MIRVSIDAAPIDIAAEHAALAVGGAGALATFVGLVRGDDGVTTLELEHYAGATDAVLRTLGEQACVRWSLSSVRIVHRIGAMVPGDVVVFVGTAAPHRAAALEACACLIDRLKTDAPFWKKEVRADGGRWVEPRGSDAAAAARWTQVS